MLCFVYSLIACAYLYDNINHECGILSLLPTPNCTHEHTNYLSTILACSFQFLFL